MTNHQTLCLSGDVTSIDITDDRELSYWSQRFKCTREELIEAVVRVGASIINVDEFLGMK